MSILYHLWVPTELSILWPFSYRIKFSIARKILFTLKIGDTSTRIHFLIILLAQRAALICCFWKQLRLRRSHSMASVSLSPSSYKRGWIVFWASNGSFSLLVLSPETLPFFQKEAPATSTASQKRHSSRSKMKALGFWNPSTWHLRAHTTRTSQSNADHLLPPTTPPHPGLKAWSESWDRADTDEPEERAFESFPHHAGTVDGQHHTSSFPLLTHKSSSNLPSPLPWLCWAPSTAICPAAAAKSQGCSGFPGVLSLRMALWDF